MADSSESEENDNVRNLRPKRSLGTYVEEDLEQIARDLKLGIKKCHERLKEQYKKEEKKDSDDELKEPKTDEDYSDREKDAEANPLPAKRGRTRRPKGRSVSTIIRMRRTRFRNQLPTTTEPEIFPISKSYLEFEELIYRVGDVVKIRTEPLSPPPSEPGPPKELNCFAQIRGFYRDQFCGKYAALQWLSPTRFKEEEEPLQNAMDVFDPAYFVQGQTHSEPIELEKLIFVKRISPHLFQNNPHAQRLLIMKDGKKEYMDGVSSTISSVDPDHSYSSRLYSCN